MAVIILKPLVQRGVSVAGANGGMARVGSRQDEVRTPALLSQPRHLSHGYPCADGLRSSGRLPPNTTGRESAANWERQPGKDPRFPDGRSPAVRKEWAVLLRRSPAGKGSRPGAGRFGPFKGERPTSGGVTPSRGLVASRVKPVRAGGSMRLPHAGQAGTTR